MLSFFRRLFADVRRGENIDLIVVAIVGISISILSLLGMNLDNYISAITLATLGVVALSLLATRHRIDEINRPTDLGNAVVLYEKQLPALQDSIESAEEIWMLGWILRNTTEENCDIFIQKAQGRGRLRVLVSDPGKVDILQLTQRFAKTGTKPANVVSNFEKVLGIWNRIRSSARDSDAIQVRLIDFVPPYSLYIFPEHNKHRGVMFIEIYGYKSKKGSVPRFRITERENLYWYRHFIDQFNAIWEDAQVAG